MKTLLTILTLGLLAAFAPAAPAPTFETLASTSLEAAPAYVSPLAVPMSDPNCDACPWSPPSEPQPPFPECPTGCTVDIECVIQKVLEYISACAAHRVAAVTEAGIACANYAINVGAREDAYGVCVGKCPPLPAGQDCVDDCAETRDIAFAADCSIIYQVLDQIEEGLEENYDAEWTRFKDCMDEECCLCSGSTPEAK